MLWQALEKRLGVTWEPIITPQPEYGNKSAALIAGGNLPDLFYLNPAQNATAQYKAMDQGAFTDLTPFVTGDALKAYKNLATFPDYMWNNVKFKNKIIIRCVASAMATSASTAATGQLLARPRPRACLGCTTSWSRLPKGTRWETGLADTWGLGRYGTMWEGWDDARVAYNMFGTPFTWRKNADGTLTHQIETDEFRQSIDFLRQLFADGAFHPDACGMTFAQCQGAFLGGKIGIHSEGLGNFFTPTTAGTVYQRSVRQPEGACCRHSTVPGRRQAVTRNTQGSFGFTAIPSSVAKTAKVKEFLRILDYLVGAFGSEEWTFLNYGIEGVDYPRDQRQSVLH